MPSQSRERRFPVLSQNGPFETLDKIMPAGVFSRESRNLVSMITRNAMRTRYRIIRNQIFEFLDVQSFDEISSLIHDDERRQRINKRAYALLGNMFGIEGNEREIITTVKSYSRTADGVIRYLRSKVLANYASHIEMTNEIDIFSSPVDLLLITFDDRYHKKARFEAKRKLFLMHLAGSIDQRERETDIENKFIQFLDFLNRQVWSTSSKIGELENVYLLSEHNAENFGCERVSVLNLGEAKKQQPGVGKKMTLIKRRRFKLNGRELPVYVSIRKKPSEAKVLKLLRKGQENPSLAVDDELGLMAVLDSSAEVKMFQKHLTNSAIRADSFMTLEEVSDTLAGGRHWSGNIGSSSETPMLKFFARLGGMRVEFIVHTNKSYIDYKYKRDISHDEYEVRRVFDSGVADLLFPRDIYYLDMKSVKERQLRWARKHIEEF